MSSLSELHERYSEYSYWGCTLLQGYYYFHNHNDRWPIKTLVQIFDNPSAITRLPWEYTAETVATYIVQGSFRDGMLAQHSSVGLAYTGTKTFDVYHASMLRFLGDKATVFKKTRCTIKSIQFLVLNRGIFLMTFQGIYLVTWVVGETHWYWMPFHMILPSVYANTMLVL
ncbi:hypothetical protein SERLADRAFT_410971 [Serpula lacrymans var. lacrymans S7.9]|uniref:Uncharacterized protein n=1 Tax=Serpula lacrymans var. lacrymans (strain S7.9) TaxID=578457 RepID=F8P8B5_SERL9|nr:uncharacterized protein SERLADRAFT_410971 [Serpula lacrymans var. lacrymans S7.9]EGO20671.1 hypothetical protein SERLADRAFT_410971 [Serpula lacrymans var. lacrymans S7.9]